MADTSAITIAQGRRRPAVPESLRRQRAEIAPFVALEAQQVPTGPIMSGEVDPHVHAALLRLHQGASQALRTGWSIESSVERALASLPPLPTPAPLEGDQDDAERTGPAAHDHYFCIVPLRVRPGGAGQVYAHSIVAALSLYQVEARNVHAGSDLHVWRGIACALLSMLGRYLHLPAEATPPALACVTMHGHAANPMNRWIHGHQIFAVITQGLIWSLQTFENSLVRERAAGAESSLELTADLLDASACAFRFAADFKPTHYENDIRPSMNTALVPEGFSGTMSADPGQLVSLLGRMREALDAARRHFPHAHDAMTAALERVYENHKHVCERFDGDNLPSLRMQHRDSAPSGVDMLERFKQRRLKMLND